MDYIDEFLADATEILTRLDRGAIRRMVAGLADLRERGGRLFFLGVGGGAGHAGHAVNDFRKIANIQSYAPTDNVSELTARINDDGWETAYARWLQGSRLSANDAVFVFSVGGGSVEKRISLNLVAALQHAHGVGASIYAVVGRDGGYAAQVADVCVIIPPLRAETVTAQTEGFQAVVWHMVVSHPLLQQNAMKWESAGA